MTPARSNSSKRNPSGGFKPYTRGVAPILVSVLDSKQSAGTNAQAGSLGSPSPSDDVPVERPGFPTYAQYKQVEAAYIQSLTPRRQGKALISQAMFDRIWDVLHQPDCPGETAQFRFWARKMFTLSRTHRSTLSGFDKRDDPPQEVILHDNLLVAVQEQLYDLLCYCHGSTGHGGRDKTCALIRKHYTWVPKDLVSNFIKACPTCILKKCGNFDSALASQMAEQRAEDAKFRVIPEFFATYDTSADIAASVASPASPLPAPSMGTGTPWPTLPASDGYSESEEVDPIETAYREAVQRARSVKASLSGMAAAHGLQGAPMTREVSLYKGLPNGWQYRHSDYASAYAEFMKTKGLGLVQDGDQGMRAKRPRVPSILPLWGADYFMQEEYSVQDTNLSNISIPLAEASQLQDSEARGDDSLQYFLGHPQPSFVDFKEEEQKHFGQQIGPSLLHLSAGEAERHANNTNLGGVSMSLKRAAAPPRLELDFSTYRNDFREADITPDSPIIGLNWGQSVNPSPTGSDTSSSGASQLSAFAGPPLSATTTVSPAGSTLQTPVDEFSSETNEDDHIGMGMKGQVRVEPEEIELIDGITQVCGL